MSLEKNNREKLKQRGCARYYLRCNESDILLLQSYYFIDNIWLSGFWFAIHIKILDALNFWRNLDCILHIFFAPARAFLVFTLPGPQYHKIAVGQNYATNKQKVMGREFLTKMLINIYTIVFCGKDTVEGCPCQCCPSSFCDWKSVDLSIDKYSNDTGCFFHWASP